MRARMPGNTNAGLRAFQEKFRTRALLVREFDHWLWSVRPVQATLGAGVLSLKRYAEEFSEVNAREAGELAAVISTIEKTLAAAFRYDKINYLMLMMVDPHVHFHVLPRYATARTFSGRDWDDKGWPGMPQLSGDPADPASLEAVLSKLKAEASR